MLDLTFLNQLFDDASDIFDGHVWIDTVLIQEINYVGLKSLEGGFDDLFDMLRQLLTPITFSI